MRAIIGGPPSTGSSLLARVLDRHSFIYCSSDESHLFSKKELYTAWNNNKNRILTSGYHALRSVGWHMYNGVRIDRNRCGIEELQRLIDRSTTFESFANIYYSRIIEAYNKQIWIEKTPGNVLCFMDYLEAFDDSITIATIRDPFEIIASLLNRGLSIYHAVCVTLTNFAFVPEKSNRSTVIKYEELRSNTVNILTKLCNSLNIQFEESMLIPDHNQFKMEGWRYSETSQIVTAIESRFDMLAPDVQCKVRYAVEAIIVNKDWSMSKRNPFPNTIRDICDKWGYGYRSGAQVSFSLKSNIAIDKTRRTARGYPTHAFNYPIKLK